MISPLCSVCNKPNWNVVHATTHPVNANNPETHDFSVPKEALKLALPTSHVDDLTPGRVVVIFVVAVVLLIIGFGVNNWIERIQP